MIKRLKSKFILSVMCAVVMVIGIVVTFINVANYRSINERIDNRIDLIIKYDGKFPGEPDDKPEDSYDKEMNFAEIINPELPYEIRFFEVSFNADGDVIAVDTSHIAAVTNSEAVDIAAHLFSDGEREGYHEAYRYRRFDTDSGVGYVFLDCTREMLALETFLLASLGISFLGVIGVLLIASFTSGFFLKPIIESYEKQKRFITDAGHEMKTPLAIISANTDVIEMDAGETHWTKGIKSQVARLSSLTEKLVILSKMEEEGLKLQMREFSLTEAFYEHCEHYKSQAVSKNVRFELKIQENVTYHGNENEIGRFISLMLDNAFRYCDEGGYVSVEVQRLAGCVEIRFKNSTSGVEQGNLDVWFDRFYRRDASRNSDTGGSGIGLSVVKAIVRAHGGTIHVSSSDGINVTFVARI